MTISDSDITQLAQCAAILSSTIGPAAHLAVFGADIDDERTALADAHGVAILPLPSD